MCYRIENSTAVSFAVIEDQKQNLSITEICRKRVFQQPTTILLQFECLKKETTPFLAGNPIRIILRSEDYSDGTSTL
jgi:hypothetical protein